MVPEISLICPITPRDTAEGVDRAFGIALNGGNFAADIFRRFGGLFCQLLYFVGHNGESFPGLTGTCRFYRRVEGEQIGLLRD